MSWGSFPERHEPGEDVDANDPRDDHDSIEELESDDDTIDDTVKGEITFYTFWRAVNKASLSNKKQKIPCCQIYKTTQYTKSRD